MFLKVLVSFCFSYILLIISNSLATFRNNRLVKSQNDFDFVKNIYEKVYVYQGYKSDFLKLKLLNHDEKLILNKCVEILPEMQKK